MKQFLCVCSYWLLHGGQAPEDGCVCEAGYQATFLARRCFVGNLSLRFFRFVSFSAGDEAVDADLYLSEGAVM